MKINRFQSFLYIFFIYALAAVFGLLVYAGISGAVWLRLLVADVVATAVTFLFSVVFKNASVYDPYWSVQPPVILLAFALGHTVTRPKFLLLFAVFLWAIRLTANWAYTFHGMAHQDWRYTQLKEQTGSFYPFLNFFGIHLVPTLVVYACVLPATYVIQSDAAKMSLFAWLCIALALAAVALQAIADVQMHRFRKHKTSTFIRVGVWKYARHPNYLAEILMWWAVALFAVSVLGFRWYYILGAVANTALFLFISIPLADGRQAKKEGFADYKAQTRMLFPIKK